MKKIDKTTIKEFDLDKYLGTWYELARYPHSFEKNLQGVTANYSIRDDGKVKVLNQGYEGSLDGKKSVAVGKAKLAESGMSGHLKVSFFWIFYGDYFIMEMSPDYQWALVGSKSDKFLWILSRTPKMEAKQFESIKQMAVDRGYDLSKLQIVQQK